MSTIADAIHALVELVLAPFDWMPAAWGLTLVSVLTGAMALWIVGKTTRQRTLERTRDRMAACIYEIRLFLDSPRRVASAQWALLVTSAKYVVILLPALVAMALPLGVLYLHLEPRHGVAPAQAGEPVVVAVDVADGVDGYGVGPAGDQDGVTVTAPPLFDEAARRVYLRVEIADPGTHTLRVRAGEHTVEKRIDADPDARIVSLERRSGVAALWAIGDEPALPGDAGIERIGVAYEDARGNWLWLSLPWWLFWIGLATVAAFALRRPMGVTL